MTNDGCDVYLVKWIERHAALKGKERAQRAARFHKPSAMARSLT